MYQLYVILYQRLNFNPTLPLYLVYSKEVKRRSIALRDSGLSVDEIAKILDTAKSNVEKWCSAKVRIMTTLRVYENNLKYM